MPQSQPHNPPPSSPPSPFLCTPNDTSATTLLASISASINTAKKVKDHLLPCRVETIQSKNKFLTRSLDRLFIPSHKSFKSKLVYAQQQRACARLQGFVEELCSQQSLWKEVVEAAKEWERQVKRVAKAEQEASLSTSTTNTEKASTEKKMEVARLRATKAGERFQAVRQRAEEVLQDLESRAEKMKELDERAVRRAEEVFGDDVKAKAKAEMMEEEKKRSRPRVVPTPGMRGYREARK